MLEQAYACVPTEEWAECVCHQCFQLLPTRPLKCPCKARWCSDECKSEYCLQHLARLCGDLAKPSESEYECEILQRLDTSILNEGDTALSKLFIRIMCRRGLELSKDHPTLDSVPVPAMADLETNEEKFPSDRLAELDMVAEAVLDALPPPLRPAPEAFAALLCAEQCNSFGVWGRAGAARGRLVGFGIFPSLCALNHACLPNCTVAQDPRPARRDLAVRALAPIPAGAELCISYSEGALLRGDAAARAAWLAATYHFCCACDLCRLASDDPSAARARARAFDRLYRCPVPGCGGLRYPVPTAAAAGPQRTLCGGCGAEADSSEGGG